VDLAILSKFGFERDLNIAKRVLLLNSTPGVDFQLHYGRNFYNYRNRYDVFAVSGSKVIQTDAKSCRNTANIIVKNLAV